MELLVPVSAGELVDKLTILQIKIQRIADPAKRANVAVELDALEVVAVRAGLGAGATTGTVAGTAAQAALAAARAELVGVNGELWEIEDRIRDCERAGEFGAPFVALARSVYRTNDRRATLKAQINELCGSHLVEEKSYAAY